ncbi:MAG: flagellar export chaperone FliS [Gammaproteobacteria bacterium]|nr:flagellar export chaperone FliS [Gammaproteobacteria bacterium]
MSGSKVPEGLRQYHNIGVTTGIEQATPHRLVQMLMAGALDKIAVARGMMERGDSEAQARYLGWARTIIHSLRGSLDMDSGGQMATNLCDLYDYMIRRLDEAAATDDPLALDEIASLLSEVKSAWDVIPAQLAAESRQGAS